MRWGWILLRGAALPCLALAMGLVGFKYLDAIGPLFGRSAPVAQHWASWALNLGFAAFLVLWGIFFLRLKAWERGSGPACLKCDGPLGWLRPGKRFFGRQLPNFRRCYNCYGANSSPD